MNLADIQRVELPRSVVQFSEELTPLVAVPRAHRKHGFVWRGRPDGWGDRIEFLAKWAVFSMMRQAGAFASMDITGGGADATDITVAMKSEKRHINVKGRDWRPGRGETEIDSVLYVPRPRRPGPPRGRADDQGQHFYVQVLVHLDEVEREPDDDLFDNVARMPVPHAHIAGVISGVRLMQRFPYEDAPAGNVARQVPGRELSPFADLLKYLDVDWWTRKAG